MGKFRLDPLEKNNYFYGKLLTVRDFKSEQDYYIHKAQLVNRMLYGSGVVTGLKTSMIDGQTLSVESGLAIDASGREIVVPKPVTQKMAVIEGFNTYKDAHELYLCLEYHEKGTERIHSMTNEDNNPTRMSDYNRIKESYQLILTDEAESQVKEREPSIRYKQRMLLESPKVDIQLRYPKYVNPGEIFPLEMIVHKKRIHSKANVEIALESSLMSPFGEYMDSVLRFKEPEEDQKPTYATRIWMIASNTLEKNAEMIFKAAASKVIVDGSEIRLKEDIVMSYSLIKEDLFDVNEACRRDMTVHEFIDASALERIYLARISMVKTGEVYQIQYVESMPYNQYVYDHKFVYEMLKTMGSNDRFNISTEVSVTETPPETHPEIEVHYKHETKAFEFDFKLPQNQYIYDNIVTGLYTFTIDENFKFGKNFVSEELSHGLGKGPAYVQVGLDEDQASLSDDHDTCVYYGASEVFYKTDFEPDKSNFTFGTLLYPKKGTFRIGLRLQSAKKGEEIRVRWWAYKRLMDIDQVERIKISIDPSEAVVRKGETLKLTANITGDSTYNVAWSIDDETLGTIDEFGEFVAGDVPGTVKVTVQSNIAPTVSAFAYVTIKEAGKVENAVNLVK